MLRLKRTRVAGVPDGVRVSAEALTAATVGPQPLTDAAIIEQLQKQLEAAKRTIANLHEQLLTRPEPDGDCPGCEGLRKVVADMAATERALRGRLARVELAYPPQRGRTLGKAVPLPPPTGE